MDLDIEEFNTIGGRVPLIANLKPHGKVCACMCVCVPLIAPWEGVCACARACVYVCVPLIAPLESVRVHVCLFVCLFVC